MIRNIKSLRMKYTWLVEKYLEGELKGEELHNFELEILKNPEIAEEVELVRNLDAFARKHFTTFTASRALLEDPGEMPDHLDEASLKNNLESLKIQKIDESDPNYHDFRKKIRAVSLKHYLKITAKNKVIIPGYIIWTAAACVTLLIAVSLPGIFNRNKSENLHSVYASFYAPYPADLLARGKTLPPADPYTMGLNEYLESNYESALSYFNEVGAENEINKSIYLLKGICLMETGNFKNAIIAFSSLSDDPILNDFGKWYTALCYLELEQPDNARKLFREISQREGYYRNLSRMVLKSL